MSSRQRWTGPHYRRVELTFITSAAVAAFNELELRLAWYARTGKQSARGGLGPFSLGMAAEDLMRPLEDVKASMDRVCASLGWKFDAAARWLLIPQAIAVSWDGSPTQLTGFLRDLDRADAPAGLRAEFEALVTALQSVRDTQGDTKGDTKAVARGVPRGSSTRTRTRTRTHGAPAGAFASQQGPRAVPRSGRTEPKAAPWRSQCSAIGHEPRCSTHSEHQLRLVRERVGA